MGTEGHCEERHRGAYRVEKPVWAWRVMPKPWQVELSDRPVGQVKLFFLEEGHQVLACRTPARKDHARRS